MQPIRQCLLFTTGCRNGKTIEVKFVTAVL